MKWAVFLDRDGTIVKEVGYLHDPQELRLLPGAPVAIHLLNEARVMVILVTNQAGIGRGYYPVAAMESTNRELARKLAAHGAHLDATYHCPHQPQDGCNCRKPQPGMLLQAAQEHAIDLRRSFVVGDKVSDLEAGWRVGCRTALVLTGYGVEARSAFEQHTFQPDHIARDLLEAVRWLLSEEEAQA